MPGAVLVPAGQGGLLLGLARGFDSLRIDKKWNTSPKIIGVQARACSPLWDLFSAVGKVSGTISEDFTLAEGVRVINPLRKDAVLSAVMASGGSVCVTEENEILPGRDALARLGLYVEPTSAIIWGALARLVDKLPDPIVVILTGSGLKYG